MPVEQRLGHITPLPRQAFLLVALEGFSEEDAAAILETDVRSVRGLVEQSGRELAAEIATDVLIIEDEVGQRPLLTLAIAASIGFLAGMAGRRH
jgi:DNA-directed RNA polymerase specialized sigma24 family protein